MAGESQITYERQDDEMIAIIDYDAGNIKSVEKAIQLLGQEVTITRDRETIMNADKVILPGSNQRRNSQRNAISWNLPRTAVII